MSERLEQYVAYMPGLMVHLIVNGHLDGNVDIFSIAPRQTLALAGQAWDGIDTCRCRTCIPYILDRAMSLAAESAMSCAARNHLRGLDSLEGDLERLCDEVRQAVAPVVQGWFDEDCEVVYQ